MWMTENCVGFVAFKEWIAETFIIPTVTGVRVCGRPKGGFIGVKVASDTHGNSKNSIRQRHRNRQKLISECGKKYSRHETNMSRRPNCSPGLPSPRGSYSPKEWMNYLTNLANTYNPSTTSWRSTYILYRTQGSPSKGCFPLFMTSMKRTPNDHTSLLRV